MITASLAAKRSASFSDFLGGFYARRIKRLVPAQVVFVIAATILISLVNVQPEISINTGITSLFGMSNLYLLKLATDYFAQSTQLNPFTHTWSLGVEEQFYIVFPFVVWFSGFARGSRNGARNLFVWCCLLTALSLINYFWLSSHNYVAAYFLTSARFWEMAAGCIVYLGFSRRVAFERALEKVPPMLVVVAMVGAMSLPLALAVPAKVVMVLLTIILIACLKQATFGFALFTHRFVLFIGLISYSLYLWHWGVLSISRWTVGVTWWTAPFQLALMFGLATLSYWFVEKPFRSRNWLTTNSMIYGFGFLLVSVTALAAKAMSDAAPLLFAGDKNSSLHRLGGVSVHLRGFNERIKLVADDALRCNINPDSGLTSSRRDLASLRRLVVDCLSDGKPDQPRIVLLGDSFARDAVPLLASLANAQGFGFGVVYGYGCPVPFFDSTLNSRLHSGCAVSEEKVVYDSILASIRPGDVVVVRLYTSGVVYLGYDADMAKSASAYDLVLNSFHDQLRRLGARLIVIGGNPTLNLSQTLQLSPQWFNRIQTAGSATFPFDNTPETLIWKQQEERLSAVAKAGGWTFFPTRRYICGETSCKLRLAGNPLYYDENHLTVFATSLFQSDLERVVMAVAGQEATVRGR